MKKIISHTAKKIARTVLKIAAGNTLKRRHTKQRTAERKQIRNVAIGRFVNTLEKSEALHPDIDRDDGLNVLLGLASTTRRLHKNGFRIHKKALQDQLYEATERVLQIKAIDEVRWENYYPLCKVNPQIAELWRLYPEKFDLTNEAKLEKMLEITPKDMKKTAQMSYSGRYFIGAPVVEQPAFPIAYYMRGNINFISGDYLLSQSKMTKHIAVEHGEKPSILQKWQGFMGEAQDILMKYNDAGGGKKKRNPIWDGPA